MPQNSDIQDIQAELLKRFRQLKSELDNTTNFDDAQAILRELTEINHRVTIAGSLLFTRKAQALSDKADEVAKASRAAASAVRAWQNAKDIMDAITGFLEIVDEALDLAKTL